MRMFLAVALVVLGIHQSAGVPPEGEQAPVPKPLEAFDFADLGA